MKNEIVSEKKKIGWMIWMWFVGRGEGRESKYLWRGGTKKKERMQRSHFEKKKKEKEEN